MTQWNLPALLDHTVLRPEATKADVLRLCQEAKDLGFVVIFVPPCYIDEAVAATAGSTVRVGIPIGFPLGGHTTTAKVAEAMEAVARGAQILDMVINVSRLNAPQLSAQVALVQTIAAFGEYWMVISVVTVCRSFEAAAALLFSERSRTSNSTTLCQGFLK